jgi:hypothetical protein
MMTKRPNSTWNNNAIPASVLSVLMGIPGAPCVAREHQRRYKVESPSRLLLLGASAARKAGWRRFRAATLSPQLPAENVAAIKLLDSWLSVPETDNSKRADEMRQRIDENRLSDRKFFT